MLSVHWSILITRLIGSMQLYNGLISQEKEWLILISRKSLRLKKEYIAPHFSPCLLLLGFLMPVSHRGELSVKRSLSVNDD